MPNTANFGFVFEENSRRRITCHRFRELCFQNVFSLHEHAKLAFFKILRFEERFRSLRVAVPTPRGKTFFLGGWVRLHVGYVFEKLRSYDGLVT